MSKQQLEIRSAAKAGLIAVLVATSLPTVAFATTTPQTTCDNAALQLYTSQTKEISLANWECAQTVAQAELETANSELAEAQAAYDEAEKAYNDALPAEYFTGSYGFFTWLGEDTAAYIVKNPEASSGASDTNTKLGQAGDATSLANLSKGLDMLEKLNELRKSIGLGEFKVNARISAISEVCCNYGAKYMNHMGVKSNYDKGSWSPCNECLAWGYPNPISGWYDQEKEYFDAAVAALGGGTVEGEDAYAYYQNNSSAIHSYVKEHYGSAATVGHYIIIVNPYYSGTTLFASMSYNSTRHTWALDIEGYGGMQSETSYTPAELKAKLEDYKVAVNNEVPASIRSAYENASATLTAKKAAQEAAQAKVETAAANSASNSFTDWANGKWWNDGVEFCYEKGLITGYSSGPLAGTFGVGRTMTRAEFATVLWRNACPSEATEYEGTATNTTGMADVDDGAWYTAAANWAVENDVIHGFDEADGAHFSPDTPMSFEQMVTIMANLYSEGANNNTGTSSLNEFTDDTAISDWARGSIAWGKSIGLVNGYENADGTRTLKPQEEVTRERVAVVLLNAYNSGVLTDATE